MNLPNKLTVFRILLVPIILAVALIGYGNGSSWLVLGSQMNLTRLLCLLLFVIASLTDMMDGKMARKQGLVTTFGKFMDPIADKMLVNSLLIILAYWHMIPVLCVILMICRDLVVDGIRLLAAEKQTVLAAGSLGKLKTVLQMIAIIAVLLDDFPLGFLSVPFGLIFIILATIVSLISGIQYFITYKDMILESV